jgi:rSAM/selenodomain-associated transferase 2
MKDVAVIIPMLNEEDALPRLVRLLRVLDPAPAEIVAVDGGSSDHSVEIARQAGFSVLQHSRGRARQINYGVEAASATLICVLHVDTILPDDAVAVIRDTMADERVALAGFTPIIQGSHKVRWLTTFHNWIKTWYVPLLFRPHLFLRGGRLLFGDHAMFFRRADFLKVGGCDPDLAYMEDADLCLRLHRVGRVKLVNRTVITSDRRIAAWGELKANWTYLKLGVLWGFGRRYKPIDHIYPDVR